MDNHVDFTKTITHLSLCSGYDGLGAGLRRIWPNVRDVAHVEIDAFAAANLVAKMEAGELGAAPVWTDIKTFPAWAFRGCVDILSAGFPCQPFSCAGARAADDDPRHIWPWVRQSIGLVRPRMVVLENVQGIISAKLKGGGWHDPEGTSVLLHVCRELERTGYTVEAGIFSAVEVGASHRRKRVFIVGHPTGEYEYRAWESGTGTSTSMQDRGSGCVVADSHGPGLERVLQNPDPEGWQETGRPSPGCSPDRWPAGQGGYQHGWEEPRTIEPGLGGADDGASRRLDPTGNRVDRLRLLGNGVVPQVAERAVRTLLSKLDHG